MEYRCRWVPGTLDRVKVISNAPGWQGQESEWSLGEVGARLGLATISDLYLKGQAVVRVDVLFAMSAPALCT